MTLDRVSTAGGYPLTRIDCINATACCHSSACGRARGVQKHEGQRSGRKRKRTASEASYEEKQSIGFDFLHSLAFRGDLDSSSTRTGGITAGALGTSAPRGRFFDTGNTSKLTET